MDALKNLYTYTRKYKYELIAGIIALILTDALGLLPPWLIKLAIDYIKKADSQTHSINPLIKYSVLIVSAVGLQAVFRYYWRKHLFGISRKVEYDLRNDYFKHLQRLHWGFFQHTKTGDIMSRATNDLQAVREFLGIGSVIIVDTAVIMTTCLILMIFISPKLTGISLLPMALVSIIVLKFSREIRQRFESVQKQLSEISSMVHENIAGIRVIQAYVQEENELNRFKKLNEQLINKNLELTKISGAFFPLMVFTTGLATALVLWIGGREVIRGQLTLGSYVAFNGYLAMLTWPMAAIGFMINLSQRGIASMRRIEEIMNVKQEIYDSQQSAVSSQQSVIKGNIEIKSLTFSYTGKNNVLSDINLNIKAGSSLSLAGAVGSGKSTLVKLIMRIYDAPDNSIFINGVDIKRIPLKILRDNIGYVEQEPFLFSDTIRENIVFGVSDVTENDIEKTVIMAGLERDIEIFPHGINTVIGERGVTLSGGQKQRVAIARAIIKKPKILILDDAFSNLDASTEGRVFTNIMSSLKDMSSNSSIGDITVILISHRISTMKEADMIAVMENGRIAETGTHEELILKSGLYNRIYKKQVFSEMEIVEE
ncbi:MAG TPA: multidrug ABC transporter ATP-binding protein [Nitrospinae bacterium]|nr:multidrug ABC transporter ATP-binding protein [Nitrospinota bacterium]